MTNNKVNKVLKRLNAIYFNKKMHVTTTTKWQAAYKDYQKIKPIITIKITFVYECVRYVQRLVIFQQRRLPYKIKRLMYD